MVHILSGRNRQEFLSVPELVRLDMPHGEKGREATLLIRASALAVKFLSRHKRFAFFGFLTAENWLLYGIRLLDDPDAPAMLWSVLESEDELNALQSLASGSNCIVHLFNEAIANVAWATAGIPVPTGVAQTIIPLVRLAPNGVSMEFGESARAVFNQPNLWDSTDDRFLIDVQISEWHELSSTYITNRITKSRQQLSLDEGDQQEELAVWFMDTLCATGVLKNPEVHKPGRRPRELSDLLISHSYGAIVVESKALTLLGRDALPDRAKLRKNAIKNVNAAIGQLAGACKSIKDGHKITDSNGVEYEVARNSPVHAIVLMPDLTLLSGYQELGAVRIKLFLKETACFLQILDPTELLRLVQGAGMIAQNSTKMDKMMGFDFLLLERLKKAVQLDSPNFDFIIRKSGPPVS